MIMICVTCDYNPNTWDILDTEDGRVYRWGGDLYGALREARRLDALKASEDSDDDESDS